MNAKMENLRNKVNNKNKQFSFLRRRYRETDFLFIGRRRKGGGKKWRIF